MSLVLLRGRLGIELLIAKKEGLCAKDENNICKKVLQFSCISEFTFSSKFFPNSR